MTQALTRQTPCALHTPSSRTWRIRRSGICPQPMLSPWHARSVAVAAAALLHASVMLAAGAVFLSCCRCVRSTNYGLAPPSISEWVDVWRIDCLLTQKLYRNGCMGLNLDDFLHQPFKTRNDFRHDQISLSNSSPRSRHTNLRLRAAALLQCGKVRRRRRRISSRCGKAVKQELVFSAQYTHFGKF